jgi:hypothetical protein
MTDLAILEALDRASVGLAREAADVIRRLHAERDTVLRAVPSRRDLLAGMAMQGLLGADPRGTSLTAEETPRVLAVAAVMFADALILELDKPKGGA